MKTNQRKKRRPTIRREDTVMVISGKEKGRTGRVITVDWKRERMLIEGLNMVTRHTKPNAANPQGGIIKQEAKINISNLMLIDPKSGQPTKVGRKRDEKTGKLVRVAKKTGEVIR